MQSNAGTERLQRKSVGRAGLSGCKLPLRPIRRRIWDAAQTLAHCGEPIIATLAKRFDLDHLTIEVVLVAEGRRHEREAAALRNGIVNALEIARESSNSDEWMAA
jgi:hypothetical protein